jgi:hypothetical protein
MPEVTTGMRERGIGDLECVDREEWRKKINLPLAQKDVKTSRICIYMTITIKF